ncbi:YolD-like family protein [Priestia megaterium]|uniref:YolD-like family protein n=1 Tax=Priestia megaterium TaxID=1404 RepID=UPI0021016B89|nr:YolD-like family protein [Priestia megaterium]
MASIRHYARAIHRIAGSHKQAIRSTSTEEQMEQINFTLIEALHTNKQVYLTYYKKGQCVTEKGFIQFVDSLGNLFVFIDEVFELKNKMKLCELIGVRFT